MKITLLRAALAALALPCAATPAVAQLDDTPAAATAAVAPAAHRPRIGLVLGGGGAMGAAHIGVLKVLEELNVPVDCVAGTSMGALVGGAYATGMTAGEIDRFVRSIDWKSTFGLQQVRRYQPVSAKREFQTQSNRLEFGLVGGELTAPKGLIATQQVEALIRELVAPYTEVPDFDQLPIPFRAVATDLRSDRMVVFRSGDLPLALRASMSVPGAFAPIELDDWLLVDGGISRNLPVDVARETCADVVIAVAMDVPEPPVAAMRSAGASLGRMIDILIERNEEASLASLHGQDVGLNILLEGLGSTDFHLAGLAIDQGEQAARASSDRLQTLAVSPAEYAAWRDAHRRPQVATSPLVAEVRFEGVDPSTAVYLQSRIATRAGRLLDRARVADDALRLYATGSYESVGHRIEVDGDAASVAFVPILKSWGPTFLAFDLGLEISGGNTAEVVMSALLRRTWPEAGGQEWRMIGQIGGQSLLETELRLPFGTSRRLFLLPRLGWYSSEENIYLADKQVATYAFRSARAALRGGVEMGTWGELQLGLYRRRDDNVKLQGDLALQSERGVDDGGWLLEFERDTRESDLFATSGSRQRLEFAQAETSLGASSRYRRALVEWNQSSLLGERALLFFDLAGGSVFDGEPPAQQLFRLGGPGAMTGLERGQWRGEEFAYSRLGLGWRITDARALFATDLYAGAAFEAGNVWDRIDLVEVEGVQFGGQLFVGGNTPFGPLQLTGGYVEGGDYAVFLTLGRPVREPWR